MSATFYLVYEITPGEEGLVDKRIEGAQAHCCVVANDPVSAAAKASYQLRKSGWKIKSIDTPPTGVRIEDFQGKDLGEKCFAEAQEVGIGTVIVAYSSVKELQTATPSQQALKKEFDLNGFLQTQATIRSQGKCLFYQKNDECHKIIDAHSIQKNGALSMIARDGNVYAGSTKFTDIRKSKGKFVLAKTHINSMSTFRGLCQYHDNTVFRPIDLARLQPSDEQVFLYAYRSLLCERFKKECAVDIYNEYLREFDGTSATKELLQAVRDGNQLGLHQVKRQQSYFDASHKRNAFSDIRYVMFNSTKAPTAVFSGTLFPEWGFNREPIQNLSDRSCFWNLITFSFAPTDSGWAFLFAWHKESDGACSRFISTLQKAILAKRNLEDLLFGLIVRGCENTAYSIDWVERRSPRERQDLEIAMTHGADVMQLTSPDYLQVGIESIHEWKFDTVQYSRPRIFSSLFKKIRKILC